ncbi:hypothetical protein [Tropicimonas sp. IMCC6043]|uniref:hypothetical protein n=1 Tax=Tropicimonas sp. IMCC6043 TaxID=2510645 RepID=UPI00101BE1C5|nr:hypothetical protein [Tropicimonas sp. IMCC6043]RYH06542.1 hypothetical protein EU800_23440 [Tropicimonas sp. IMCC6043]
MPPSAKSFLRDETGAVTVDWIVLTAGVVTLALGVTSLITVGTGTASDRLASTVAERPVGD